MEDRENIYKIKSLNDNGVAVTLTLIEDIELEPVSQQQMMLEAINRAIPDKEMKEQLQPIMEAMLRAQPQTIVQSYPQTSITITMPKRNYENYGKPQVGESLIINILKRN
ncbi:MAG TPA: hypothetical protein VD815_11675 [Candidatus Saccharimonadales bacterium]|nr:hypothetical protein [Candidatus Saccharimonadales bacterium]